MCGIVFTNKKEYSKSEINKIISRTSYRGPDQSSYKIFDGLIFGFNYLSITGTFKGAPQPFVRNGNVLIFNGEIFNHNQIRSKLKEKKLKFKTNSDTELLSVCLEYYGIKKTHEIIQGMWSFIYYEKKKNIITVSRDRIGIKPLFFSKIKKEFFFSSSIETVRQFAFKNSPNVDRLQIKKYIELGSILDNNKTLFKNIQSFPSAHYCKIKNGTFTFVKYWNLNSSERKGLYEIKKIKEEIQKKFNLHFNYKVRTALPLSSGLDSNFILSQIKNRKNLFCYSLKDFDNDLESDLIKKNIIKNNKYLNHKFINCRSVSKKKFFSFVKMIEYPIRSFQPYFQFLIRQQAKKDRVRIILNGDGADEVFGGYSYGVQYRASTLILQKKFKQSEKFLKDMQEFTGLSLVELKKQSKKISKKKITLKKFLSKRILKTHIPYWLYVDDFISMKNKIENRVPYLDSGIIEKMMHLNEKFFFYKKQNKFVLRFIAKNFLKQNGIKFHKPGNYSLIYNKFSNDIVNILKSNFLKKLNINFSLKDYKLDKSNNNFKKSDKWFRVFFIYNWLKLKKINA